MSPLLLVGDGLVFCPLHYLYKITAIYFILHIATYATHMHQVESLPIFRLISTRMVRPILALEALIVSIIISEFVCVRQLPVLDKR